MDTFKHIIDFQNKTNNKEVLGMMLYMGKEIIPFSDDKHKRYAVPMSLFFLRPGAETVDRKKRLVYTFKYILKEMYSD